MIWPDLVCARDTGEQVFSIQLFRYGQDNGLYAHDHVSERFQKWNAGKSRWEAVVNDDEIDDQLGFVPTVVAMFPLNLAAFLVVVFISLSAAIRPRLRGAVSVLGAATLCSLILIPFSFPKPYLTSAIGAADFSPGASRLATASWEKGGSLICIWDATNGDGLDARFVPDAYVTIAFSSGDDGRVVQTDQRAQYLWDFSGDR